MSVLLVRACPCGQFGGCGETGHWDVAICTGAGCIVLVVASVEDGVDGIIGAGDGAIVSVGVAVVEELPEVVDVGCEVGELTGVVVVGVVGVVVGVVVVVATEDVVPEVEGVSVVVTSVALPVILEKIFFRVSPKVAA